MTKDETIAFLLDELQDIGRPDYVIRNDWAHMWNVINQRMRRARKAVETARQEGFDWAEYQTQKTIDDPASQVSLECFCLYCNEPRGVRGFYWLAVVNGIQQWAHIKCCHYNARRVKK